MIALACFALAVLVALLFTPLAIRAAWATRFLDQPDPRKLHRAATPLLGGLVVFAAGLVGWLAYVAVQRPNPDGEVLYLMAGAAVALALGLWDDRFGMGVVPKLVGQSLAVTILMASGRVPDLGLPIAADVVVSVLALVALMNAVNFLDNMNGMVAGLVAIALMAFALTSAQRGAWGVASAQLALAGGCVGFLRYNFPRARIFLGDAGSLLLGYSLGASALLAYVAAPEGWGRVGPALALAYPAFDLIFVVVNRLREGRKIHQGGKDHSNHRLASVLQCQKKTVMTLWAVGAGLAASGLVVQSLNQAATALSLSALWLGLFLWMGHRLSSVPIEASPPTVPAQTATEATARF